MSHRHEQKHFLHNWSDCRYRDRPQSPRAVLRVRLAGGAIATKRTIFVADAHRKDRQRFVVRADENLRALLKLKGLADESFRLWSVGQSAFPSSACLRSFDEVLMFAAGKVFLF
jgi:hypothetical protein